MGAGLSVPLHFAVAGIRFDRSAAAEKTGAGGREPLDVPYQNANRCPAPISVLFRGQAPWRPRGCRGVQPRFLSGARDAARQAEREAHAYEQNLRWHEIRLLD